MRRSRAVRLRKSAYYAHAENPDERRHDKRAREASRKTDECSFPRAEEVARCEFDWLAGQHGNNDLRHDKRAHGQRRERILCVHPCAYGLAISEECPELGAERKGDNAEKHGRRDCRGDAGCDGRFHYTALLCSRSFCLRA